MKHLFLLLGLCGCVSQLRANNDTLKNHAGGVILEAGRYTGPGEWGFVAGHNSEEQQQFGEKYYIEDAVKVSGVVAYLATSTGTVTDPGLQITFRLWGEDPISGRPSGTSGLQSGVLELGNAHLGDATVVMFANKVRMEDAFFVTMDLGDYGHDGLEGDTVGLYHAPDGSRTAADIANVPYRNVYQAHGHGSSIDWKDFYAEHTTAAPVATHLALYPIVEMDNVGIGSVTQNGLRVMAPYPHPAGDEVSIPFHLSSHSAVEFRLMDMSGRTIRVIPQQAFDAGSHAQKVSLEGLGAGTYVLSLVSEAGAVGIKVNKL